MNVKKNMPRIPPPELKLFFSVFPCFELIGRRLRLMLFDEDVLKHIRLDCIVKTAAD